MSEVQETEVKVQYKEESPPLPSSPDIKQDSPPTEAPSTPPTTTTTKEESEERAVSGNDHQTETSDPSSQASSTSISDSPRQLRVQDLIHTSTSSSSTMADGRNEARALRVLEILNDFRTLQMHITSLVTRADANPPDQASVNLPGYALLRQCNAQAQAILANNPNELDFNPGRVPDTEAQKQTLQRIILDASTRRFGAHKVYLLAAAAMRWVMLRKQAMALPKDKQRAALAATDTRLQQERSQITDQRVYEDLRNADRQKGYWIDEDPSLEKILAWYRRIL